MALKDNLFYSKKTLNINGNLLDLSTPKIMGILNVTTDSFYDGGKYVHEKQLNAQVEKLLTEGADMIDVGGYSSRPAATDIAPKDEIARVLKGIKAVRAISGDIPVSVDTFRSEVAKAAIHAGAGIVNDISGGGLDKNMFQTISENNVSYVLMHMVGNPQNMTKNINYKDIIVDILDYFDRKLHELIQIGIKDVIIDVGFGFSKTTPQNYHLISNLDCFHLLNSPILVGVSRKSMVYKVLKTKPDHALNGTSILHAFALLKGANILRVHDVKEAKEVITLLKHIES